MLFRGLRSWIAAIALAAFAIAPAAAQIPDPYARQLAQALSYVDQAQAQQFGFSRAAGPFGGGVGQGEGQRFAVTLRANQPYRIAGVCDARCGDMDLRVFDANGALVAQDIAPNRAPIVDLNPAFTGGYAIEASIAQCATATCYFAFNIYAR